MSLAAFGWLIVKLLVLAFIYFGLRELCKFLNINISEQLWKIFAAILIVIGVIYVLMFVGVG